MNTSISVVLPAAGSGERFGCLTPKQYCCIVNRPLICYTVESFIRIPWIFKIVVVSSSNSVEQMKMCLSSFSDEEQKKIQIIQGGASRHQSIYLGLRSLKDDAFPPEIVVIHDGVRPVVPEKVLEKIVDAAKTYGAAGVVRPLVSTVVSRTEESFLDKSLDRRKYCASEMPQAFNYSMMLESYGKCSEYDLEFGTECLQIAHSYGNIRPKLIMSDEDLWKVTHKKDLYATEGMIKENIPVLVNTDGIGKELLHYLQSTLCKKFQHVKMGSTLSTETSLKNVNQVKFHQQKGLSDVLLKECEHIPLNNTTVHVITQPENRTIDHSEIRKRIKEHALMLRKVNSCIYFICMTNEDSSPETISEICEVVTELLFNHCLTLSGQILYI